MIILTQREIFILLSTIERMMLKADFEDAQLNEIHKKLTAGIINE